jgi:hypothetical protein
MDEGCAAERGDVSAFEKRQAGSLRYMDAGL